MTKNDVSEWLKKYRAQGVRPELLAAYADISIDTLRLGLRGLTWSKDITSKLQNAMSKIEKERSEGPNSAA